MNAAAPPLLALASGDRAGLDAVLQHCWFDGLGVRAFGTEEIAEAFRRAPLRLTAVEAVSTERFAAVFGTAADGATAALCADLNDGGITRLWRLGTASVGDAPAPATGVPADLDLDQRGGRLAFEPRDHPALSPTGATQVRDLGEGWLRDQPPAVVGALRRARPIVLRSASDGERTAALFRIEGASPDGRAGAYVAALLGEAVAVVRDAAGLDAALAAPWTPQLRGIA